jgi:hypothetical protein
MLWLSSLEGNNLIPVRGLLLLQVLAVASALSKCPHFGKWEVGGDLSYEAHCCLGAVSVPHDKDVIDYSCPFWNPR